MNLKRYFKKEKVLPALTSIAIAGLFFLLYFYLGHNLLIGIGITSGILLALLLGAIMLISGYMVLKALFFVAAEISLIIFLAQSYCAVPHTSSGDQALKSLLFLSFVYIIVSFCRKFYEIVKDKYPVIANDRWSKEKITFVSGFLIFSILLLMQIYQVVNPIIGDLCVYSL